MPIVQPQDMKSDEEPAKNEKQVYANPAVGHEDAVIPPEERCWYLTLVEKQAYHVTKQDEDNRDSTQAVQFGHLARHTPKEKNTPVCRVGQPQAIERWCFRSKESAYLPAKLRVLARFSATSLEFLLDSPGPVDSREP